MHPAYAGEVDRIARAVLAELLPYRRAHALATPDDIRCIESVQLPLLRRQIAEGSALQMLIPAFPAKSPSCRKVLGALPDLGERLSLSFLGRLCGRIQRLHAPGAELIICSDGHVFGPAVGLDDDTITDYQRHIERMVQCVGHGHLRTFALADCSGLPTATEGDYEASRVELIRRYGTPLPTVRTRLLASEEGRRQLTGMMRFMLEDREGIAPDLSRSAAQQEARDAAYVVIQRSWAWGDLLSERFPEAFRLSIHPQPPSSLKFGIHLLPTRSDWLTPWHGVAATDGQRFELMKRHQAEALGGRVAYVDGLPSHFVLDALDAIPGVRKRAETRQE